MLYSNTMFFPQRLCNFVSANNVFGQIQSKQIDHPGLQALNNLLLQQQGRRGRFAYTPEGKQWCYLYLYRPFHSSILQYLLIRQEYLLLYLMTQHLISLITNSLQLFTHLQPLFFLDNTRLSSNTSQITFNHPSLRIMIF